MKEKRLLIAGSDPARTQALARSSGLSPLLCAVLVARGIFTAKETSAYLDTSVERLLDPMTLRGMSDAVSIIRDAIEKKERIAVYGDYDVDGVTATCVLTDALCSLGADCLYYIPDRLTEGYGLHIPAVDQLREDGVRLLITVDTGITAAEEVAHIHASGMRVVITDHHECPVTLPAADAVVNPKNPDCSYAFRDLAGVGVAFKLVTALLGDAHTALDRYAELVCLGTVADVMPLRGENRVIVNYGLRRIPTTRNLGLAALCREAALPENKSISATSLSFALAPRINAAGRFGLAGRAAELFLTQDESRAKAIASELTELNRRRQGNENQMLGEAIDELNTACDPIHDRAFVLWHREWHHGILGIVASRLTDRYARPVILLSIDGETAKGSGRSIRGFNLYDALAALPTRPRQFGGHELAAGLTLDTSNLDDFRRDFQEYADSRLTEEDCVPCLDVDCEIEPNELSLDAVQGLSLLEPTGMGNPEPVFFLRQLVIRAIAPIGNNRHTRMRLERAGCTLSCVYFGKNPGELALGEGDCIDVAANAQINDFRGRTVQLILREARLSENERAKDRTSRALYSRFHAGDALTDEERHLLYPNRPELVAVWRYLAMQAAATPLTVDPTWLYREIHRSSRYPLSLGKLMMILDVFSELGLLSAEAIDDTLCITLTPDAPKADLNDSVILASLR
ncbi:MAG: single-stranded-DNA-specific exonuclease RecJ [Clostridiaceae bacterium]|nr:single-stranded-DNA-specific exonuclease RecJ [Clostridiaceae bacterium]